MAVLLDEPHRASLVECTHGISLQAPPSLTWEVGNALASLVRRNLVTIEQAGQALEQYENIPVRFADIDVSTAVIIAGQYKIYAYDAYVIECALKYRTPLLSLDRAQCRIAEAEGIELIEVAP